MHFESAIDAVVKIDFSLPILIIVNYDIMVFNVSAIGTFEGVDGDDRVFSSVVMVVFWSEPQDEYQCHCNDSG